MNKIQMKNIYNIIKRNKVELITILFLILLGYNGITQEQSLQTQEYIQNIK